MHLPGLLTTAARTAGTARAVLRSVGARNAIAPLALAAAVTALFPDGTVDRLGPLSFQPEIRAMVFVPLLLGVACAVSHVSHTTPVLVQGARVRLARGAALALVVIGSTVITLIGAALSAAPVLGATWRNLLLLAGMSLLMGAVAGAAYAWVLPVALYGAAIISPAGPELWTPYGLLLADRATTSQLAVAGLCFAAGAVVSLWNPAAHGYLRRASGRGWRRPRGASVAAP